MKKYLLAIIIFFSIALAKGYAQEKELYVIYDVVDQSMQGINFNYELRSCNGKGLCSGLYKPFASRGVVSRVAAGSIGAKL